MTLVALGNAVSLLAEATAHEKSKTAFYIAGGALAGWAVLVGVFGFTHPDFPGSAGRARVLMGISLVLMLSAVSAAAITGSNPPPASPFVHIKLPPKGTAPQLTPVVSATAPAGAAAPAAPKLPPGQVALAADPAGTLKFTQASLTAKAGKVTIVFSNDSPIPHNVAVAKGAQVLGMTPTFQGGGTKNLALKLTAGSYTYYCTVPGHRDAGMQGTLTVQ
ncbi:MAG: cupredoxin domain-containing protein [Actinobacteria bacterium]|nr:cupredoxin domain-containing protein [Actinomycetota bacterium]